jgi:hypothetical protein
MGCHQSKSSSAGAATREISSLISSDDATGNKLRRRRKFSQAAAAALRGGALALPAGVTEADVAAAILRPMLPPVPIPEELATRAQLRDDEQLLASRQPQHAPLGFPQVFTVDAVGPNRGSMLRVPSGAPSYAAKASVTASGSAITFSQSSSFYVKLSVSHASSSSARASTNSSGQHTPRHGRARRVVQSSSVAGLDYSESLTAYAFPADDAPAARSGAPADAPCAALADIEPDADVSPPVNPFALDLSDHDG